MRQPYAVMISLVLTFSGLLVLPSCKDDGPGPPPPGQDTTSHSFAFQIDTLGDGNSSQLFDVKIISDTLAYAVGEIYLRDSTGQFDQQAYNLVRCSGTQSELLRMQFFTFCGQQSTGSYPAKSVFPFSAQDVWIAMDGSQVVRWNGQYQTPPVCIPVSVDKLWGENPNSLYAVGYGGIISYYGTGTWQRLASGTTLPIQDVWGASDPQSSQERILCVASNKFLNEGKQVLRIENSTVTSLPTGGLPWSLSGIYSAGSGGWYIVGDGIYHSDSPDNGAWQALTGLTPNYTNAIRGEGTNDIAVAGDFGTLLHYNGSTWRNYTSSINLPQASFFAVDIKGNMLVAVGNLGGSRAIVVRGRRN